MSQRARVIHNLRQLLQCRDHQRIAIERLALTISRDLAMFENGVAFDDFQRALAAYHASRSSLWRAAVAEALFRLESGGV